VAVVVSGTALIACNDDEPKTEVVIATPEPPGACLPEIAKGLLKFGDRVQIVAVPNEDGRSQPINLVSDLKVEESSVVIHANAALGPHYQFFVDPDPFLPARIDPDEITFLPQVRMIGWLDSVDCDGPIPMLRFGTSFWDICNHFKDASVLLGSGQTTSLLDHMTTLKTNPCSIGDTAELFPGINN
jgi:hypothetical protein